MNRRLLIFGASGALGRAIGELAVERGFSAFHAGRQSSADICVVDPDWASAIPTIDAVVWAQGINISDSVESSSNESLLSVLQANLFFIQSTLKQLIEHRKLNEPSRLVILSSIWQELARANKFSYTVSKAAVGGLVRATAADLASSGVACNGLLVGVVDSEMTRQNLQPAAIAKIESETPGGELVRPENVAEVALFLASPMASGINGTSLVLDGGWSVVRTIS